ncbi:ferritin-like fold-containing protein [Cellulomonas soli]
MTATPAQTADAVELLGLVAQLEHLAFARLAADAAVAPTPQHRLELSRLAAAAVQRRDRVLDRVRELGGEPLVAMALYDGVLDDFDARTEPSTWWERLLTVYVGYGVADDFCRLAAGGLDDTSRALVLEVLDDAAHTDLAVAELDAAGTDTAVSARLALWGRRLVGEALGVVQRLVVQRPGLVRLLDAPAAPDSAAGADAAGAQAEQSAAAEPAQAPVNQSPTKLFGQLTAEHTRRMTRLGLTA